MCDIECLMFGCETSNENKQNNNNGWDKKYRVNV